MMPYDVILPGLPARRIEEDVAPGCCLIGSLPVSPADVMPFERQRVRVIRAAASRP